MKNRIYLIVSMMLSTAFSWGQNYLTNYSPDRANSLCSRLQDTLFDSNEGFLCQGGSSTLYFTFNTNVAFTWGTPIVLKYRPSPLNSSYKVYGPFDANDNYMQAIATNTAPVVIDAPMMTTPGSGGIYWRQIDQVYTELHKKYVLAVTIPSCSGSIVFNPPGGDFICGELSDSCENCIPKFQPVNNKYLVSAWIKEENNPEALTYTKGYIKVTSGTNVETFYASGQIIDGWQRIEGVIQTDNVGNLTTELVSISGNVYFDDIRIFPFDGSMVTYVYDPKTLRLVAELDERNYAKIYEYDEEGKLIRVKKETEKGIMTIQENRENTSTGF